MIRQIGIIAATAAALGAAVTTTSAQDIGGWLSGDWYLKLGGSVLHAPKFEGASGRSFAFQPMISLGKSGGRSARFSSRNDNISLAFRRHRHVPRGRGRQAGLRAGCGYRRPAGGTVAGAVRR